MRVIPEWLVDKGAFISWNRNSEVVAGVCLWDGRNAGRAACLALLIYAPGSELGTTTQTEEAFADLHSVVNVLYLLC